MLEASSPGLLAHLLAMLPYEDTPEPGRFVSLTTRVLKERLQKAHWEALKHLPAASLTLYRTYDLGEGVNARLPASKVRDMLEKGYLQASTQVTLVYRHLNVYSSIEPSSIDLIHLLDKSTYALVCSSSGKVFSCKVGAYTAPNSLYERRDLHEVCLVLERALRSERIRSYDIREYIACTDTDCP